MNHRYGSFLRAGTLPSVWCPGCGNGVVVKAMLGAVSRLGITNDDLAVIGGIGCSGRTPFFIDANTMHTTHGRALAFATGVKLTRPRLTVLVTMGDGDTSGIGGNHFIHACRRNIDMTAVVFNNGIYGQTGGQLAPTTPLGRRSMTSPAGSIDRPFDLCRLAEGAAATFVARTSTFDYNQLEDFLCRAIRHRGFSVVDVLTTCPTYYGRMNGFKEPYEMLQEVRRSGMPLGPDEEPACVGQACEANPFTDEPPPLPLGVFVDEERAEYTALHQTKREGLHV